MSGRLADKCRVPRGVAPSGLGLLAAAQRVHIGGHLLDLDIRQTLIPRRHDAKPRLGDLADDRFLASTVKPDLVGEIGSAQRRLALAQLAMAGDAVLGEEGSTFGVVRALSRECQDVFGDRVDLRWLSAGRPTPKAGISEKRASGSSLRTP